MLDNFISNSALIRIEQKKASEKTPEKVSDQHLDTPPVAAQEWSPSIATSLNTSPQVWTRGLLYILIALISVVLPWSVLTKIDETGTAKGRVEAMDDTVKLDSTVAGTVSQILVNEGDMVKAGQVLLTVGSELITSELQQAHDKLEGQKNRLNQLNLLKGQLVLTLSTQQQQNKSVELEKQSQIDQARRNLEVTKNSYNLLESEKRAQLNKARQNSESVNNTYNLLESEKKAQVDKARQNTIALRNTYSPIEAEKKAQVDQAQAVYQNQQASLKTNAIILANAQRELDRYTNAWKEGVVAEIQVAEKEGLVQEKQRLYDQNKSDIEQTKQRLNEQISGYKKAMAQAQAEIKQTTLSLTEQTSNYGKAIEQAKSDITQNKLNLTEQVSNYGKVIKQAKSDIEQAELRAQQQEQGLQGLVHSNELALLKIKEQLKSNDTEMGILRADIAQSSTQVASLQFQLAQRTIKAPQDGVIYQLPIKKAGAVVQLGTPIVEMASQKSQMVLRAHMPTSESGYVKKGLPVKLKFDAYPFQDYGIIQGKILSFSPTTSVKETTTGKVEGYKLEVSIDRTCQQNKQKCIPLHHGDTATAEVIVRQRRIIDFVLDPFKKMKAGGLKL
jgi:hemolysin D